MGARLGELRELLMEVMKCGRGAVMDGQLLARGAAGLARGVRKKDLTEERVREAGAVLAAMYKLRMRARKKGGVVEVKNSGE